MNKILVTGATGFAGGHILRYLANKFGTSVVFGTGRNKLQAKELIANGYSIFVGDLNDSNFVRVKLSGFDVIVHCAAKSSIWGTYDSFYKANVLATNNLLEVLAPGKQIIYISTANIYFNYSDRFNIDEKDHHPNAYSNYYATTKYEAERIVLESSNIFTVALRPRAIIGVGDTVVFPRVLKAYNNGKLRIIGKGDNVIDFTSINNLCHAVNLCIENKEKANSEMFNVTNGDTIKLWDQIKLILSKLGRESDLKSVPYFLAYAAARFNEIKTSYRDPEPTLTVYGLAVLKYSVTLNIDKITEHLGYIPVESSVETVSDFLGWYKNIND
jgi:nucleoside-diphosphate-sugar epimerase